MCRGGRLRGWTVRCSGDPLVALDGGEVGTELMVRFLAGVEAVLEDGGAGGDGDRERAGGGAGSDRPRGGMGRGGGGARPFWKRAICVYYEADEVGEMDKFLIEGGATLSGTVVVSGSKNASLPILAAALLTKERVVIRRVPDVSDTNYMLQILRALGAHVERGEWGR